ncbi:MAG: 16S rRNA (cytosine(1402)-N(4))-methyltransferase RsmH [Bacteroidales bacterium]|nr:16S rRNA (cytosine(1402)-N(4))-methyltransferase RsmH [Bacteroidales bacterium]
MYHIPVLLNECIEGLNIRPDGIYVDVTYGSGGHSRKILEKLASGKLIAFDLDQDVNRNLIDDDRFLFIQQNFRFLKNFLNFQGIDHIDGLLADLGISSWQIDQPGRGVSTRMDGPLDMRMNQENGVTAENIINSYAEDQLIRIFRQYGEIENAWKLSGEILKERALKPIGTTEEFKQVVLRVAQRGKENQYLARVFQAIRIEVNEELEALKELIVNTNDLLIPGGRMVIISYHSLEDRLVKNYFKTGNFDGVPVKNFFGHQIAPLKVVSRKAITPSDEEQQSNPRSRSAKLRIAEKI